MLIISHYSFVPPAKRNGKRQIKRQNWNIIHRISDRELVRGVLFCIILCGIFPNRARRRGSDSNDQSILLVLIFLFVFFFFYRETILSFSVITSAINIGISIRSQSARIIRNLQLYYSVGKGLETFRGM